MAKSLEEIEAEFRTRFSGEQAKSLPETDEKEEPQNEVLIEPEAKLPITESHQKKYAGKSAIISDILFYFALIAMVVCAVLFSRGAFGQQTFGGYRFYEVLTTSMESVYPRGSLVLIKEVSADALVMGDDITFARDSANVITHRIIEIVENYDGNGGRGFITKGVENSTPDADIVSAENIIGKVVKGIPGLGRILRLLGENLWIILVFFILLIACSFFLKIFFGEGRKKEIEKTEGIKDKLLNHFKRFRNDREEIPPRKEE